VSVTNPLCSGSAACSVVMTIKGAINSIVFDL
jgi:hypothetical protein